MIYRVTATIPAHGVIISLSGPPFIFQNPKTVFKKDYKDKTKAKRLFTRWKNRVKKEVKVELKQLQEKR